MSSVLVRALLAYPVHEHQAGSATRLHVMLKPRSCTVEDDGRGMGLNRDGYVSGLLEQLAARGSEVALHGIGLAIVPTTPRLLVLTTAMSAIAATSCWTNSWWMPCRARDARNRYREHGDTDLLDLALRLAETPCSAIGYNSPARLLREIVERTSH